MPLTGDYAEEQVHSGPVSRLRLSFDETRLFSTSEDGSVALLEIREKGDNRKVLKPTSFDNIDTLEEILVSRSDMEEKQTTINEMKSKYDELALQHEYQTKLRELNHTEKIKELTDKMNHDLDAWKMKVLHFPYVVCMD